MDQMLLEERKFEIGRFFVGLKAGDTLRVDDRGIVERISDGAKLDLDLPYVDNQWHKATAVAQYLRYLLSPLLTVFNSLVIKFIQACDKDGHRLELLTADYTWPPDRSNVHNDQWDKFAYFEFQVITPRPSS